MEKIEDPSCLVTGQELTSDSGEGRESRLIERLINGASLRTFMVPDECLPGNFPEHIETYDLPHIIIKGDQFWGNSGTSHLFHIESGEQLERISFSYTNMGNCFCSYTPSKSLVMMMSKRRYKKHEWRLRDNYRLAWDSATDRSTGDILREIESCSKFKIALLDSENIWNIHPVDLPMYYHTEEQFELKTVMDEYPLFFRNIEMIKKGLLTKFPGHYENYFDSVAAVRESPISGVEIQRCNLGFETPKFPCFYSVRGDGSYYNFFDIPRKTTQKYKRLKVFVDST